MPDKNAEGMTISMLGGASLVVRGEHIDVPRGPKTQFKTVVGRYIVFVFSKEGERGDVKRDDLGGAKTVNHFCRWINSKLKRTSYKPDELLRDLRGAEIDLLALEEALRFSRWTVVRPLLSGCQDLFPAVTAHIPPEYRKAIEHRFRALARSVLATADASLGHADSDWLMMVRNSYERLLNSGRTSTVVADTEFILSLPEREWRGEFRALWSRLYYADQLFDLGRSLSISEEAYGDSFGWAIGMTNLCLVQGRIDEALGWFEEAKVRHAASDLGTIDKIALEHLSARLKLRELEDTPAIADQINGFAAVVDATTHTETECLGAGCTKEDISSLILLRANTLLRMAFNCRAPDQDEWTIAESNLPAVRNWCVQADSLLAELAATTQAMKALASRSHLHHQRVALGVDGIDDRRQVLRSEIFHYLLSAKGQLDFGMFASDAYSAALVEGAQGARRVLLLLEPTLFEERGDQQMMWCCLMGYLFTEEKERRDIFRVRLSNFIEDRRVRIEFNYQPLKNLDLLPEPVRFHHAILEACRWGTGLLPLLTSFRKECLEFARHT